MGDFVCFSESLNDENLLRIHKFATRFDFVNLIDKCIDDGKRKEANVLARIILNLGFDSKQYPFNLNELYGLSGLTYPYVIEFIKNQRGLMRLYLEEGYELERLKFIAQDDFFKS